MSGFRQRVKTALLSSLKPFDLTVMRLSGFKAMQGEIRGLQSEVKELRDREFLRSFPPEERQQIVDLLKQSKSQIGQDLFVLSELGFKKGGFFVEFGASDGIKASNTYLLERKFEWRGILAEPARTWHEALKSNRCAQLSTKCVWSKSHSVLTFNEAKSPMLSTLESFSATDLWATQRKDGSRYEVETVSLLDLLMEHSAPREIDYLSIDTEGSEFEILSAFDFSKYRFSVITCEHNFTPAREAIRELLQRNGYMRKNVELSQFDDWYVHGDIARR
jgi:FkbM family methyltransferase